MRRFSYRSLPQKLHLNSVTRFLPSPESKGRKTWVVVECKPLFDSPFDLFDVHAQESQNQFWAVRSLRGGRTRGVTNSMRSRRLKSRRKRKSTAGSTEGRGLCVPLRLFILRHGCRSLAWYQFRVSGSARNSHARNGRWLVPHPPEEPQRRVPI